MASTVIDSFIVELGLDPSKFEEGQRDALSSLVEFKSKVKQSTKDSEDSFKKVSDQFEALGQRAVSFALTVVSVRSLATFARDLIDLNRQMGNMADVTGESIQKLTGLASTFERLGGTSQGVLTIVSQWNREMNSMNVGAMDPNNSSMIKFLNSLLAVGIKINATDAKGNWRKATDIFVDVSERLARSGVSNTVKSGLLQSAGIDQDTAAVMLRGGEAMRQHLKEQEDIYQVTEEQRRATDRLNNELATFDQRIKSLGQVALIELAKSMESLLASFKKFTVFLEDKFSDPTSIFYMPTLDKARKAIADALGGGSSGGAPGGPASLPDAASSSTGSGQGHGGRFNVPAGTAPIGGADAETVTLSNGEKFTVNKRAAAQFKGFYDDLIKAGAPVHSIGGVGSRGNPSQHPIGLATDWAQTGRDQVAPDVQRWISQNPQVLSALEDKWGMSGGEHWGNPDTGHFSIDTLYGYEKLAELGVASPWAGSAAARSPVAAGFPSIPFLKFNPATIRKPNVTNIIKNEVKTVTVNTQAADAAGIAGDIKTALKNSLPSQRFLNSKSPGEADAIMQQAHEAAMAAGR